MAQDYNSKEYKFNEQRRDDLLSERDKLKQRISDSKDDPKETERILKQLQALNDYLKN